MTNLKTVKTPKALMATIDHIVSRYSPYRWVKYNKGQIRKVLACWQCNHDRCELETLSLSRAEILKRSQGFSLSPRGNPTIKPKDSIREVKQILKDRLTDPAIVVK